MTRGKNSHIVLYTQSDIDDRDFDAKAAGLTSPGWYFWDETGAYAHGPYADESIADAKMREYANHLNGE